MDIILGSFNVLNLNTKDNEKSDFKEDKCSKIADIIRKEGFDIIALQEIQTDDAVSRIIHYLNGNDNESPYQYCHCGSLYQELNDAGILNRNGAKFKSDYGFIWNTDKVYLYGDKALYKALDDIEKKEWDSFIEHLIDILVETYKSMTSQTGLNSGLFARLPQGEALSKYRSTLRNTLHQTLRPPLIACFRPSGMFGSLLHEIRIINTHTQWNKGKSDEKTAKQIRMEEMNFIQRTLHNKVNELRTGSFNSVYTFVAGDFNLSAAEIGNSIEGMITVQNAPSTCKWDAEQNTMTFKSNYDHFAYNEERITHFVPDGAKTIGVENDNFTLNKSNKTVTVSDHIPIKMKISF